jgi:hypothetical protein
VNDKAVVDVARRAIGAIPRQRRGGVSVWDASGIFQDLAAADSEAGAPSARMLLLLYAADLAFRLRWEIRPAREEGRVVVAAPYVMTAVAVGRAAGLPGGWLRDLFRFAPPADEAKFVDTNGALASPSRGGFVEFGAIHLTGMNDADVRHRLLEGASAHLRAAARRHRASGKK